MVANGWWNEDEYKWKWYEKVAILHKDVVDSYNLENYRRQTQRDKVSLHCQHEIIYERINNDLSWLWMITNLDFEVMSI